MTGVSTVVVLGGKSFQASKPSEGKLLKIEGQVSVNGAGRVEVLPDSTMKLSFKDPISLRARRISAFSALNDNSNAESGRDTPRTAEKIFKFRHYRSGIRAGMQPNTSPSLDAARRTSTGWLTHRLHCSKASC